MVFETGQTRANEKEMWNVYGRCFPVSKLSAWIWWCDSTSLSGIDNEFKNKLCITIFLIQLYNFV